MKMAVCASALSTTIYTQGKTETETDRGGPSSRPRRGFMVGGKGQRRAVMLHAYFSQRRAVMLHVYYRSW